MPRMHDQKSSYGMHGALKTYIDSGVYESVHLAVL